MSRTSRPAASLPSLMLRLAPLAFKKAKGLSAGESIPRLVFEETVSIPQSWHEAYTKLTGHLETGVMPPCAPQVLAADLHRKILADARFPLPVLGMVHIENRIDELMELPATASLRLRATLSHTVHTDRGVELDIQTEAFHQGQLAWRSVLRALIRHKQSTGGSDKKNRAPIEAGLPVHDWRTSSVLSLPEDLGRRYAIVAGDANPIHLHAWAAKPFGFPKAIVHGMWTLARSVHESQPLLPMRPRSIHARFLRPVLLPSKIVVSAARADLDGGTAIDVMPTRPGVAHMKVHVGPIGAISALPSLVDAQGRPADVDAGEESR